MNKQTADRLIQKLSKQLGLAEAYAADAAVDEGYTIEEHTRFVVMLFDYYFKDTPLPLGFTRKDWRIFLALHDVLGKPAAIEAGDKRLQHEYLYKNLPAALRELGYGKEQVRTVQALLANDCIGEYVQNQVDTEGTAAYINQLAATAQTSAEEALTALVIYWIVDAGSYTSEVGPMGSLDFLFAFDRDNRSVQIKPPASDKIRALYEYLLPA